MHVQAAFIVINLAVRLIEKEPSGSYITVIFMFVSAKCFFPFIIIIFFNSKWLKPRILFVSLMGKQNVISIKRFVNICMTLFICIK